MVARRIREMSDYEKELLWRLIQVGRKSPAGLDPDMVDHARRQMSHLTPREREIMTLVVAGLRGKEIAAKLGISPRTVETHRIRVLGKLGARSVAHLCSLVTLADADTKK